MCMYASWYLFEIIIGSHMGHDLREESGDGEPSEVVP